MQKSAVRILTDSNYNANSAPLFKKLHLLMVGDIFEMQACTYGWKFRNKKLPSAIANLMEPCGDRLLQIKGERYTKSTIRKHSPIDFITRSWNAIPIEIKRSKTIVGFKKAFCNWKIDSY